MEIAMKKEKHSDDKISEQTLHEILLDIKYRLNHIEDITADNRAIIVKLVKQSNQIVRFLSNIDIETVEDSFEDMELPSISDIPNDKSLSIEKAQELQGLVDDFMERKECLKEFEEELKKYKDEITPGQIGES